MKHLIDKKNNIWNHNLAENASENEKGKYKCVCVIDWVRESILEKRDLLSVNLFNDRSALASDVLLVNRTQELSVL